MDSAGSETALAVETESGFAVARFADRYGETCSIQESSLADDECIWLGRDDATPKVLASQAAALGLDPADGIGWVDYPIPEEVQLATRMHLTRQMVRDLLPLLRHFVDNGALPKA